jgi:hypothetical protein
MKDRIRAVQRQRSEAQRNPPFFLMRENADSDRHDL